MEDVCQEVAVHRSQGIFDRFQGRTGAINDSNKASQSGLRYAQGADVTPVTLRQPQSSFLLLTKKSAPQDNQANEKRSILFQTLWSGAL